MVRTILRLPHAVVPLDGAIRNAQASPSKMRSTSRSPPGMAVLLVLVPSFVGRIERNVIINPHHDESAQIETSPPVPVWWDRWLFTG